MSTTAAATGQVPRTAAEIYDAFFVPALFGQWASPLCDAAGIEPGQSVLDVACGSGATTQEAAARVGHTGHVTGLDRNDGMLAVARSKLPGCEWVEARAEDIPFADNTFDAVLCQFGLMFFDDRVKALVNMQRVLRPKGRLALSVWDVAESSPGYAAMIALIDKMFGQVAADALRAPFVLGEKAKLLDLLAESGLGDAQVDTSIGSARFDSIREWVRMDVRGWTLSEFIDDSGFEELVAAAEKALSEFAAPDGTVSFPAPAHIVSWSKPMS